MIHHKHQPNTPSRVNMEPPTDDEIRADGILVWFVAGTAIGLIICVFAVIGVMCVLP